MMSTPQQLAEMLSVLDDDALARGVRPPDAFVRPETKEILDTALYPWLFSHTHAEAPARRDRGWPLTGVNTPEEALEADHLHQRGFWVNVEDRTQARSRCRGRRTAHGRWLAVAPRRAAYR